jgi:hypothetical protein
MNPFVIGFLTKCAQYGLSQDVAVALLMKAANSATMGPGSISMPGPSSAATSSASMGPVATAKPPASTSAPGTNASGIGTA